MHSGGEGKADMAINSINDAEAAHFNQLAKDWWDPKGSSAMLHRLNPVRLSYIRQWIDHHWPENMSVRTPLAGKSALDVGCGAGLLCEPLARLGANVTGLDAAEENIRVASDHAAQSGLDITYHHGGIENWKGTPCDVVTSLEVIEHVNDPEEFIAALTGALADNGLLILSTPNRTQLSKAMMINLAETFGKIPRGTHDWDKFLTPAELQEILKKNGLKTLDITGLAWNPFKGLHLSEDLQLNYILAAVKG